MVITIAQSSELSTITTETSTEPKVKYIIIKTNYINTQIIITTEPQLGPKG